MSSMHFTLGCMQHHCHAQRELKHSRQMLLVLHPLATTAFVQTVLAKNWHKPTRSSAMGVGISAACPPLAAFGGDFGASIWTVILRSEACSDALQAWNCTAGSKQAFTLLYSSKSACRGKGALLLQIVHAIANHVMKLHRIADSSVQRGTSAELTACQSVWQGHFSCSAVTLPQIAAVMSPAAPLLRSSAVQSWAALMQCKTLLLVTTDLSQVTCHI